MSTVSEIAVQYATRGARAAQRADRNVRESIQTTADTARQETGTINRWMQRHKAAIQTIGAATAGALGGILAASPTFRAEMAGIRTAFSLLADTIVRDVLPSTGSLTDAAFNLVEAYQDLSDPVREVVSSVVVFGGIIAAVGLALSAFVGGPIALAIGGVAALAAAFATDFMGIRSTVMDVLNALQPFIESTLNTLTALWRAHGQETIQSVRQLVGIVRGLWTAFGQDLVSIFASALQLVLAVLRPWVSAVLEIFDLFTDLLAGDWRGVWESITSLTQNAINGIAGIIRAGVGLIGEVVDLVIDAILAPFQWLYGKLIGNSLIPDMFDAIPEIIRSKLGAIGAAATAVADTIVGALPSPSDMISVGQNIASGIAEGIRSKVDAVGDAATGLAGTIRSKLPGSDADEGPLSDFTSIPDTIVDTVAEIGTRTGPVDQASRDLASAARVEPEQAAPPPGAGGGGGTTSVEITIERGAIQMRGGRREPGDLDTADLAEDIFSEAERRFGGQTNQF